jgi:hypothetical protein
MSIMRTILSAYVWKWRGKTSGIYVGVQPRPLWLFDKAPNDWRPARSGPDRNCACDSDIKGITTGYFDIDVVSLMRKKGHPASDEELDQTLDAARLLCREDGLALCSTICCSGNGHYGLVPIVPIPVDNNEVALKFRTFCRQLADKVAGEVTGVKFDSVYNLSRVMRVIGTSNLKGQPIPGRPYRRAHFVTEPILTKSVALHHMILNAEVDEPHKTAEPLPKSLRCDLQKLENCEFIAWCRAYPEDVSEPAWWAMITNLAHLENGIQLIHEISQLDRYRYDYVDTQRVIQRVISTGYRPVSCATIVSQTMTCPGRGRFQCSQLNQCPAKAPMYMVSLNTVYDE